MLYHIIRTCQGTKRELLRALTVADNAVHDPRREGTGRLFLCLEERGTRKPTCYITLCMDRKIVPGPMVVCSRTLAANQDCQVILQMDLGASREFQKNRIGHTP